MNIGDIYAQWKEEKKRQVKQSTLACYALNYRNNIAPYFNDFEIENIDKRAVKEFVNQKLTTHSVKTVRDTLIVLKMLLKYAEEEFDLTVPSTNWNIPWPTKNKSEESGTVERYSQKEVKMILEYAQDNPSYLSLALIIAFTTGMRIGELCALKYEDIDFDRNIIRINKTIGRMYECDIKKTAVIISNPKTYHSNRNVPMNPVLKKILKKYSEVAKDDYYVITGKSSYKEPRVLRNQAKNYMGRLGIEKVLKFHATRHTFATMMIENKVDPKTLSTILGHSDVSVTLNLYVHPSDSAKANAVARGLKGVI